MAPTSPTVAQWEYSLRLKRRREELGLSVQQVADHLGFSRNFLSAVENERAVLADIKFEEIVAFFELSRADVNELRRLRSAARDRGWWTEYASSIGEDAEQLYGLEYGADHIRTFQSLLIPGLLQTPAYARAVIQSDLKFSRLEVETLVEVRRRRQERLHGPDPLRVTAVLSEAVLRQHVGPHEILLAQLHYLLKLISEHPDTLTIRVVPFDRPLGPLVVSSTLLILEYESDFLPSIGWQETIGSLGRIDDPNEFDEARLGLDEALDRSLGEVESRDLIEDLAAMS